VTGVPAQTEDTYTGGNSKDINDISAWTYNNSGPQNKANLENAIAAAYLDPNNNNHTYLYVAADRFDNSGSMALGVWFLQTPVGESGGKFYTLKADGSVDTSSPAHHVNGDLLLVANFGSGTATITSFTWNNGTIPATGTTLNSTIGTAVVNSNPLDGASGHAPAVTWPYLSSANGGAANFVQSGEFFEAGVDLNLLFPGQTSFNFSSFIVETRASTSPTATLSDFIVGHVSTAPDVTVNVAADASNVDAGTQVGFTVSVANVGVGDLINVSLADALPAGAANDIVWSIAANGNPSGKFVLTGNTAGSQTLTLQGNTILANNSQPISVHIVGTSSSGDVGSLVNTATVSAANEAAAFLANNQASASITLIKGGVSVVTPQTAVEGASTSFDMGSYTSAASGTASVSVNWGDGSLATTFSFANTPNNSYAMPAQTHTYGEEGSYTVTETVTLNGVVKTGSFTANVSDPDVVATGVAPISKDYTGLAIGSTTLATFKDPGGAEPNAFDSGALSTHYTASVDWGAGFGSSAATISFSGTAGSKTDSFTVTGLIPYVNVGTYNPVLTINHEASTPQTVNLTVTINPVALTITADADVSTAAVESFFKTYNGQVYSGFSARYSGFVNGETPAVLGGALTFSGAGVSAVSAGGPYTVTPGGLTSGNYAIKFFDGTLNIGKASLTITADANTSTAAADGFVKTYDGTVFSPFTVRYSGFVPGEDQSVLSGTLGFTGAGATAVNAGGPYTVTPGGLTSGNYAISFVSGGLTISKAHLTVTADNKSFNEGTGPSGLSATITGFVHNETLGTSGVSGSAGLSTPATGTSAPGTYAITATIGTLTAVNYDFTTFNPGTLTVQNVAPAITMSKGTISLSAGDGFSRAGSFADPGTAVSGETWTITTDYGDGTVSGPTPIAAGSFSIGHIYSTSVGSPFTVTVTITDKYGAVGTRSFSVVVNAADLTP
jgi:uncharacterized repeat protein (TIGR01451 family)